MGSCLKVGASKKKMKAFWCPPHKVSQSLTWMEGAAREKLGLAGIGGVLRNCKVEVWHMFQSMSE